MPSRRCPSAPDTAGLMRFGPLGKWAGHQRAQQLVHVCDSDGSRIEPLWSLRELRGARALVWEGALGEGKRFSDSERVRT